MGARRRGRAARRGIAFRALRTPTPAPSRSGTEGVTGELVRAGRFEVVSSTSTREVRAASERARDVATALDADVLVEARVIAEGEHLRIEARAVSGDREEKFWVDSFAGPVDDIDALEREVAAAVGAALAIGPRRE